MSVRVLIPTPLRGLTGDQREVTGSGSTLAQLLQDLETRHPGLEAKLLSSDRRALRRFVLVFVNGQDVAGAKSLETPLTDGDEVAITLAIAGG